MCQLSGDVLRYTFRTWALEIGYLDILDKSEIAFKTQLIDFEYMLFVCVYLLLLVEAWYLLALLLLIVRCDPSILFVGLRTRIYDNRPRCE